MKSHTSCICCRRTQCAQSLSFPQTQRSDLHTAARVRLRNDEQRPLVVKLVGSILFLLATVNGRSHGINFRIELWTEIICCTSGQTDGLERKNFAKRFGVFSWTLAMHTQYIRLLQDRVLLSESWTRADQKQLRTRSPGPCIAQSFKLEKLVCAISRRRSTT